MGLIDAALRGALIALLVLMALALWPQRRHARRSAVVWTGIVLALSLAVQAVSASPWAEYALSCPVQAPGIGVSLASAVAFWLFARAVFDEDFRLRRRHGAVWGAVFAYGATVCLWQCWWPGFVLMRAIPVAFVLLGLAAVVAPWRADLVEKRRRWRGIVVGGGMAYALVMVVLRAGSADGRLAHGAALADVAMLLALAGFMAARLLAPRAAGLWDEAPEPAAPPPVPAPRDPQDEAVAAALARAMGEGRGYAQEGLSLAGLAAQLGTPEYRLRRVINQGLGHRNFNAYVNGLRLAEARRRLADPTERALPVLTIALDVGFGSVGPFNRAFKAETGLTPTEFRQKSLADS
ncbi:AraC family transcriptional regulator [Roseateles saccharophilus]|uniref:AraC family transcriptional regulator n=1 Tax=Roseateles saccharophilus TaxID=304 RepID=A0A4V2VRK6_ROSSA|nr:helix-turn-helix domain-containing protein [Roseateles saccharophilus]MDG0831427.1 AraC family transcriptional regulator [Roseateles saccharophilus]TCU98689.1 AraC family transcriptional regulator [Roseateles saccharophilus]